jgi:small-conductance mechanosensitive channel
MRFLFIIFTLLLVSNHVLAANPSIKTLNAHIKQANEKLDKIKISLALPNTTQSAFNSAIVSLTSHIAQANECVAETQKELDNIESLIKQGEKIEQKKTSADLIYLNKQQKNWSDIQAQCRLFTIQANEAISNYKHTILQLKEKATLMRGVPLWTLYKTLLRTPTPNIHIEAFKINPLIELIPHSMNEIGILLVELLISLVLLFWFKKSRFAHRFLDFKRIKLLYIALFTLCLHFGASLVNQLISHILYDETSDILTPNLLLCSYFTTWLCLIFIFKIKSIRALMTWYNIKYRFARAYLFFILCTFVIAYFGKWLNEQQLFTIALWQMFQSLYLFIILLVNFTFIEYFCHSNHQKKWLKHHSQLVQISAAVMLSIPALLATLGYLALGLQLLYAGFVLFTILFFMGALILGFEKLYRFVNQNSSLKQSIINYFGYKHDQILTEFLILKITGQLLVLIFGLFLIAKATGFSSETIELAYDQFLNGLHIANMIIYPTRIFLGVIIFCIIYLTARAISNRVSAHQQFEEEEETQVAVASILTYIGFSIAAISGLLISGFDFTGLAIIAGALSVGIGLGLQSIVNNFVSGLILLIEKPIKPGDRISIDGVEGFVKKIRVRSTQLITSSREDIIIPNSNLITRNVVNYMLTDKHCRVTLDISVAYGSDTYLVRDTLLEVANQHDEVIKTERNKACVLLHAFGDSALIFRLSCLIKDVNRKSTIQSDINFEIDRIFRERRIEMPFIQREIHLKIEDKK